MKISVLNFQNSIYERIKDLVRPVAPKSAVDTSLNIINYGPRNDFPIKLAQTVENSPTGNSNIGVLQTFIKGEGFNSEDIQKFEINKEQTMWDMHNNISDQFGLFDGFAIRATFDADNWMVKAAHALQFQGARFQEQDENGVIHNILFNPWYGTKEEKPEQTIIYPVFDPDPEKVKRQAGLTFGKKKQKFEGQCLYFGKVTPTSPFYPRPSYWSAKSWFNCDWLIGEFHENNINNNFLLSFIVEMLGDPNAPSTHPKDREKNTTTGEEEITKTVGERFDLDMSESLSGATEGGKALVIWQTITGDNGTKPSITAFPSNAMDTLFVTLAKLITENIARATRVPPILANIEQAGSLSDASKIREATELMNKITEPERLTLERNYKKVLGAMKDQPKGWEDLKILPFKFFKDDVPDEKIWSALTPEEQRAWIKKNTNIELSKETPKPRTDV